MPLQQIVASQANAEVPVNENFQTLEHMSVYAKKPQSSSGLTWAYYGGRWAGYVIADGTISLTASSTNYIVVNRDTGAISNSTTDTNWNNGLLYARVYKIVTGVSTLSSVEDWRVGRGGVHGTNLGQITVSELPPSSPQVGDLWLQLL